MYSTRGLPFDVRIGLEPFVGVSGEASPRPTELSVLAGTDWISLATVAFELAAEATAFAGLLRSWPMTSPTTMASTTKTLLDAIRMRRLASARWAAACWAAILSLAFR